MKASLSNLRQSPRKVRLVADLIRGKSIAEARRALSFLPKKSAPEMLKLLESAVANARSAGSSTEDLFIKSISVNKGIVMRRFIPKARGRAARFARTSSIISLELGGKSVTTRKAPASQAEGGEPESAEKKPRARKTTKKTKSE